MNHGRYLYVAGAALSALVAMPAAAQSADGAALRAELDAMRGQMQRMADRIDELERQLADTSTRADAAGDAAAQAGAALAAVQAAPAKSQTTTEWKGAPRLVGSDGWSFKPRGRIQIDAGFTAAPSPGGPPDGYGSEARRVRLGVDGTVPGGFGYKLEADFTGGGAELYDAMLTYADGGLTIAIGQQNNFQGLEELSSSLFSSFLERAAFTDAFGFERRLGASVQYQTGDLLLQGGVFGDNAGTRLNKSWSVDGRAVLAPKLGKARVHLGSSAHFAQLNDSTDVLRYRQRPFVHFTDQRPISTGQFTATNEWGLGLETAIIAGPLHAAVEGFWQRVGRPDGLADPTFFGGYAEIGYFLTGGDTRGYKGGKFDRVSPARPVGAGGIGAVQLNLRYDRLDLTDAGIAGGTQDGYGLSLVWTPTAYTRVMASYMLLDYDGAFFALPGNIRSFNVDAFGMRAQVDF